MSGRKMIVYVFIVFFMFVGCEKPKENDIKNAGTEHKKNIVKVEAFKIFRGKMFGEINTSSKIEGIKEAVISGEASGKVLSVNVELGSYVKKGKSIITLDGRAAEAMYEQSKIQLQIAENNLATVEKLANEGNASEIEVKTARSQEKMAMASVERNRRMCEGYSLPSPIGGYVINKYVRVGEQINPGTPVAKLADIRKLKLVCFVGEDAVAKIRKGRTAEITIPALGDEVFVGKIIAIGAGLDDRTGGYAIEIVFRNTKDLKIKSGMTADIKIITEKKENVLLVPQTCVLFEGTKRVVYRIHKGIANKTVVSIGRKNERYYEVLSGLHEGDIVVGSMLSELKDGVKVEAFVEKE